MATDKDTIYVATESVSGNEFNFVKDQTRVSGAWLAKHKEFAGIFKPLEVHYDVEETKTVAKVKVEAATAAPGKKRK
jgi:hypothetical protein